MKRKTSRQEAGKWEGRIDCMLFAHNLQKVIDDEMMKARNYGYFLELRSSRKAGGTTFPGVIGNDTDQRVACSSMSGLPRQI